MTLINLWRKTWHLRYVRRLIFFSLLLSRYIVLIKVIISSLLQLGDCPQGRSRFLLLFFCCEIRFKLLVHLLDVVFFQGKVFFFCFYLLSWRFLLLYKLTEDLGFRSIFKISSCSVFHFLNFFIDDTSFSLERHRDVFVFWCWEDLFEYFGFPTKIGFCIFLILIPRFRSRHLSLLPTSGVLSLSLISASVMWQLSELITSVIW